MRHLLLSAFIAFGLYATAQAAPLPETDGTHFYAVTMCGSVVGFIWFEPGESPYVIPAASVRGQELMDAIMAARNEGAADGQSFEHVADADADCTRI